MRVARPVTLSVEQRSILEQRTRARSLPVRTVERARIVLRAADGRQDLQIAEELGITAQKAARWRKAVFRRRTSGIRARRTARGRPAHDYGS